MKARQSRQHPEEPGRLANLLAEREGTGVRLFHLRGAIALDRYQRCPSGQLESELLLETLGRIGYIGEQLQSTGRQTDRLLVRIIPLRVLRRLLQIVSGPLIVAPQLKVHGQFRRNLWGP